MAEFTLDEDQKQIQDMVRKFAQNEMRPLAREADERFAYPAELLEKVWELGFSPSVIPEAYGGYEMGRSAVTAAIIAEELAWGDLSLALGAMSTHLMMIPILEFGTEEQKTEWLPKFCQETPLPATAALMEPRITFNPLALKTTAVKKGDQWVLNGTKAMVPFADQAEYILVYAAADPQAGASGVEAFIVARSAAGLTVGERESLVGLNPLPLYPITLQDCEVPESSRIGGADGIDYQRLLNLSRANFCAMAAGVARASFEYARDYAKERVAFGEPIASRQSIAFMLAEAAMEVDAMRLLAWKTAWMLDQGQDATRMAGLAKNYCAEQTMKIVDYGLQVLGGHGYIREHPTEMWFRNGRTIAALDGLAVG